MMRHKKAFVLAGLFFCLSTSVMIIIGRSLEKRAYLQEKAHDPSVEALKDTQVNKFLLSFFSFKTSGENYSNYEIFLTEKAKENEKSKIDQGKSNPHFFSHSVFLDSKNYIRKENDRRFEVISEIKRKIDLVNQEGNVVTRNLEKIVTLKITYLYDEVKTDFLVDDYEYLEFSNP